MKMSLFFLTFSLMSVLTEASEIHITAKVGDNCTLPCSCVGTEEVDVLTWTCSDRDRELIVVSAGRVQEGYESPEYTGRVELVDPHLQKGDLSVVLKNVTLHDSGPYECQAGNEHKIINQFIRLNVIKQEKYPNIRTEEEPTLELVPAVIGGVIVGAGIVLIIIFVHQKKKQNVPVSSGRRLKALY